MTNIDNIICHYHLVEGELNTEQYLYHLMDSTILVTNAEYSIERNLYVGVLNRWLIYLKISLDCNTTYVTMLHYIKKSFVLG